MTKRFLAHGAATAMAAILAAGLAVPPASAQTGPRYAPTVRPTTDVALSVGTGRLVQLDRPMSDIFVANDAIADVQVRSATQVYIFGKTGGQTSVYATDRAGKTIWSANVRVGTNIGSVDELLAAAMPDAKIQARPINGMILLTGTVAAPADVEEAARLVQAYVGAETQVLSRLKTATPLQVMLKVKIAEVSRSLMRNVGVNLENMDPTGGSTGFVFTRGRDVFNWDDAGGGTFNTPAGLSSIGLALNNLFGLNVAGSLDLNENNGTVTTLAEPTLTALSGETASFLAGGEFPIPIANGINGTSIEFKQYGVSLAFTPFVLDGGRISMRVRPEVSNISSAGAIRINNLEIPAVSTRRTETTVELGSGQSMMIGGLLSNDINNTIEKTPWLGSLPVIGSLFRSNGFRKNETELVVIVTPYLVRPVNADQIALPTDSYRSPTTSERVLLGSLEGKPSPEPRPGPRMAQPQTVAPGIGDIGTAPQAAAPAPRQVPRPAPKQTASAAPGFSF